MDGRNNIEAVVQSRDGASIAEVVGRWWRIGGCGWLVARLSVEVGGGKDFVSTPQNLN